MTRQEIVARLADAFGPHMALVRRETGRPGYEPDSLDDRSPCTAVFADTDGQNSIRILTYGEIADVLKED